MLTLTIAREWQWTIAVRNPSPSAGRSYIYADMKLQMKGFPCAMFPCAWECLRKWGDRVDFVFDSVFVKQSDTHSTGGVLKKGQEPIAKLPRGCSALLVPDPFFSLFPQKFVLSAFRKSFSTSGLHEKPHIQSCSRLHCGRCRNAYGCRIVGLFCAS